MWVRAREKSGMPSKSFLVRFLITAMVTLIVIVVVAGLAAR
jgi:hypothetical protein